MGFVKAIHLVLFLREANLDHAKFKPGCVIFDKDGTLVCFHTMWSPWCTSLANRMSKSTGMTDISGSLYDVLGYDHAEEKVRIGALAENTHPQVIHPRLTFKGCELSVRFFSEAILRLG